MKEMTFDQTNTVDAREKPSQKYRLRSAQGAFDSIKTRPWSWFERTIALLLAVATAVAPVGPAFAQNVSAREQGDIDFDAELEADEESLVDRVRQLISAFPEALPDEPSAAVGLWKGKLHVDESGALRYDLPLPVPPGRAGLTPALGFSYNSNGAYGSMGMGWNLSGLSSAHRCGRTYASDGELRPLAHDVHDAICLDGQRLRPVRDDGVEVEYRTDPDTHVRIVGTRQGESFLQFRVWLPDGTIRDYGSTASARIQGLGVTRVWAVDRILDRSGNSISVSYESVTSRPGLGPVADETIEFFPARIEYGANDGSGGGEELPNTRALVFFYGEHPKPFEGFSSGFATMKTKRLERIEAHVLGDVAQTYEIGYRQASLNGRSLVDSLMWCDGAPSDTHRVCLPANTFVWEEGSRQFQAPIATRSNFIGQSSESGATYVSTPDVNGDGKKDLLYYIHRDHTLRVALSHFDSRHPNADPFPEETVIGTAVVGEYDGYWWLLPTDFDRDGREDTLLYRPNRGWSVLHSLGLNHELIETGLPDLRGQQFADLDGDGRVDMVGCDHREEEWFVSFGTASGFSPVAGTGIRSWCPHDPRVKLMDLDGDGSVDVLTTPNDGARVVAASFANRPGAETASGELTGPIHPTLRTLDLRVEGLIRPAIDVNGDGLQDIPSGHGGTPHIWLNTGRDFLGGTLPLNVTIPRNLATEGKPGDFDGDGVHELLAAQNDGFYHLIGWDGPFRMSDLGATSIVADTGANLAETRKRLLTADFDGNGVLDVLEWMGSEAKIHYHAGPRPHRIKEIREGTPRPTYAIQYAPLSDHHVYTTEEPCGAQYPSICVPGGDSYVVARYKVDSGIDDSNGRMRDRAYTYFYHGARVDLQGRGWLGFQRVRVHDDDSGSDTWYFYDHSTYDPERRLYPFVGLVKSIVTEAYENKHNPNPSAKLRHDQNFEYEVKRNGDVWFPYLKKSTELDFHSVSRGGEWEWSEPDQRVETDYRDVDDFGNPRLIEVANGYEDVERETHSIQIQNDVARWILGRPRRIGLRSQTSAGTEYRVENYTWYERTGLLHTRTTGEDVLGGLQPVVEMIDTSPGAHSAPDEPRSRPSTVTVEYDGYGHASVVTHSTLDEPDRVTSTEWTDAEHIFPEKTTNAEGHVTERRFHPAHGEVVVERDPNGAITRWAYDGFGRAALVVEPWGARTVFTRAPEAPLYSVRVTSDGDPESIHYVDRLGRVVRTGEVGLQGQWSYVDVSYDLRGRQTRTTVPYREGGPAPSAASFIYDWAGRIESFYKPGGGLTSFDYAFLEHGGVKTTITNPKGKTREIHRDRRGRVVKSVDDQGNATSYRYGPFGVLREVEDPAGHTSVFSYDPYGRQLTAVDPSHGRHAYRYNGFGELNFHRDGNGDEADLVYDRLGRLRERHDREGKTEYTYDSAEHGIGLLGAMTSPDGIGVTYAYDLLGRPRSQTREIRGESFTTGVAYDDWGRIRTVYYPKLPGGSRLAVDYKYSPEGHADRVVDRRTQQLYWQLLATDAAGRPTEERLGNDVETTREYRVEGAIKAIKTVSPNGQVLQDLLFQFDENGNVTERGDLRQNMTEVLGYDALDRLTSAQYVRGAGRIELPEIPTIVDGPAEPWIGPPPELDLSELANSAVSLSFRRRIWSSPERMLTPSSGSTTVRYDALGNITFKSDVGRYHYDAERPDGSVSPQAVSMVGPEPLRHEDTRFRTFAYDGNGNQTRRGDLEISYTAFDKVRDILDGDGELTTFLYDAERTRTLASSSAGETIYIGGLYERRRRTTSAEEPRPPKISHHHFIAAGGRIVAQIDRYALTTADALNHRYVKVPSYFHEDHLGSLDVVSNASGVEVERRSYSVFGERRDPDWRRNSTSIKNAPPSPPRFALGVTLGFSGHEDDDVGAGLVDMQGRMYDATLGRFLSADPFVAQPLDSQGLNRYSYVRNNPVTLVDPTGYVAESLDRDFNVCFGAACRGGVGSVDGSRSDLPGFTPDLDPHIQAFNPAPQILTGPAKWLAAAGSAGFTLAFGALISKGAALCLASAGTFCGVLAVGAVGYGIYQTYKLVAGGGWQEIAAAGQRFWNDEGTLQDALIVGSAAAGVAMTAATVPGVAKAASRLAGGAITRAQAILALRRSEVFYRTMSAKHAELLFATGELSATAETFISPTRAFSEAYAGVLVKFQVRAGTTEELALVGVRDASDAVLLKFPNMPRVFKGWAKSHAFFKKESEQINVGLGRGEALRVFNRNILRFHVVRGE